MTAAATAMDRGTPRAQWRYYLLHLGLPLLAAALVYLVFEHAGVDRALNSLLYDPVARRFPLRDNWFLETVGHHWAKYLLIIVGLSALAGFALSFLLGSLRARRRVFLFVFLAMSLGPALVGYLKEISNKHCPYDLEIYGGYAPYRRLFEAADAVVQPGRCWPGGHASGGFGSMAFYFVWRRSRPRLARAALGVGLGYGLLLGFGRMLQGAHFLSHNLWSAIMVWLVALLLYELILRRHPQPGEAAASVSRN